MTALTVLGLFIGFAIVLRWAWNDAYRKGYKDGGEEAVSAAIEWFNQKGGSNAKRTNSRHADRR